MINSPSTRSGTTIPSLARRDRRAERAHLPDVNNGVYRRGFATTQAAYEEAVVPVFETLDWLEARLSRSRYLLGECLAEADIRLFTTPARFDAVYYGHFKCNLCRIIDYPALCASPATSTACPASRRR